jgi:type IV secretion system protein VirB9
MSHARATTVLVWTKSRTYVFDFAPGAAQGFKNRTSKVVLTLPRQTPVPASSTSAVTANALQTGALRATPMAGVVDAGPCARSTDRAEYRNDHYSMQVVSETADIRPREAFDNGRFTYLKFPNNAEIPAIFRSIPGSKEEVVVNSHRECEYVVLHAVSPLWTLRLGGSVIGVFNDSYEPEGAPPRNGSSVTGLERVLR